MQAIILAAGKGTRLKELTQNTPKPMLKVGNGPLLSYILTSLKEIGITDFVLITKYLEDIIKDYYKDGRDLGINITYITQQEKYGTGAAVEAVADAINSDEVFVTFGDIVVPKSTYENVKNLKSAKNANAAIGLNYVDDPYAGAAVILDGEQNITDIVEKPPKGTVPSHWNNAGIMAFDSVIFDYVKRLTPSERGEYELTTSIFDMINDGLKVCGYTQNENEFWQDIGTPEDLIKANNLLKD